MLPSRGIRRRAGRASTNCIEARRLASVAAPSFAFDRNDRYDRHDRYETNDYRNNERRIEMRLRQLQDQYNSGLRKGGFDRGEQRRHQTALSQLSRQADQYARTGRGVDDRELAMFASRADDLWRAMSVTAHDNDRSRRYR